jgi:SAM-dependent methyltransferase
MFESASPRRPPGGKFEYLPGGRLEPSADVSALHPGSRYAAHLQGTAYVDAIERHVDRGPLLDVGCGHRPLRPWYLPRSGSAIALDRTPLPGVDAVADLEEGLPFSAESFRTVLASDVFEHVADIYDAFRECSRVMRRDGTLIVGTPFLYMIHEEPYDYLRPTEFLLRRAADAAGLTTVEIRPIGGAPDVLLDLMSKFAARGVRSGRLCYRTARAVASRRWVADVRRSTARRFPLGYVSVFHRES